MSGGACENIYREYDIWRMRICILKRKFWRYNHGQWLYYQFWWQKPWGTFRSLRKYESDWVETNGESE